MSAAYIRKRFERVAPVKFVIVRLSPEERLVYIVHKLIIQIFVGLSRSLNGTAAAEEAGY